MALQLADMEAFLKRRLVEEERAQNEIQDAFGELNRSVAHCKRLYESQTCMKLSLSTCMSSSPD